MVRLLFGEGSFYQPQEQRMWFIRPALEFRVELHADIKIILRNLNGLHDVAVRGRTADDQSAFRQSFPI